MFGEHAAFIIPAYLITAASLIGMLVFIRIAYRSLKLELMKLEEAGLRRRSSGESSVD